MRNTIFLFSSMLILSFYNSIHAAEYVLPYPSFMPGNKLYKVSRGMDRLQEYWHWGNIAKTKYYMSLSDKYLVEAKTLFEYKQYLLAVDAIKRSDEAWSKINLFVEGAKEEKKDVTYLEKEHQEQSMIHQRSIDRSIDQVPEVFLWSPEKNEPTQLELHKILKESLIKRTQ